MCYRDLTGIDGVVEALRGEVENPHELADSARRARARDATRPRRSRARPGEPARTRAHGHAARHRHALDGPPAGDGLPARRASACARWASATRSSSTRARRTRCSARSSAASTRTSCARSCTSRSCSSPSPSRSRSRGASYSAPTESSIFGGAAAAADAFGVGGPSPDQIAAASAAAGGSGKAAQVVQDKEDPWDDRRSQRPVPVRQRQEVQEVPRREAVKRRRRSPAMAENRTQEITALRERVEQHGGVPAHRRASAPSSPSSRPRPPSPASGTTRRSRRRRWRSSRAPRRDRRLRGDRRGARRRRGRQRARRLAKTTRSSPRRSTAALKHARTRIDTLEVSSWFTGEFDHGDAIVTITPGQGGLEAQDWAEMLLRMYTKYASARSGRSTCNDAHAGVELGIDRAVFTVHGRNAYGMLQSEMGVHRLVRISPTDEKKRRQTTFAGVEVLPLLPDDVEVDIRDEDLRIDVYRSSGPGGQSVNTTDSAVRITHMPTGLVVTCQNEKSQHKNKDAAMKILRSRLYEIEKAKRDAEIDELRGPKRDITLRQPDPQLRALPVPAGEGRAHRRRDRQRRTRCSAATSTSSSSASTAGASRARALLDERSPRHRGGVAHAPARRPAHAHRRLRARVLDADRERARRARARPRAHRDHRPRRRACPQGAHPWYFWNLKIVPSVLDGVRAAQGLRGQPLARLGERARPARRASSAGSTSSPSASTRTPASTSRTASRNTEALLRVMAHPLVDQITHPGNEDEFPLDLDAIVEAAVRHNVILELNDHSFDPTSSRAGSGAREREFAEAAVAAGAPDRRSARTRTTRSRRPLRGRRSRSPRRSGWPRTAS